MERCLKCGSEQDLRKFPYNDETIVLCINCKKAFNDGKIVIPTKAQLAKEALAKAEQLAKEAKKIAEVAKKEAEKEVKKSKGAVANEKKEKKAN